MRVYHEPSISHLRRAAGRKSSCVFRIRNGVTDVYESRGFPNPNTSEQQLSRQSFGRSCEAWQELSADEKLAWHRYATAYVGSFVGRRSVEPLTGNRVFQAVAGNLQILGLAMRVEAPSLPPPEGLRKVELLPSTAGDTLRLRLEHGLSGSGYSILVSMSPATLRPSRKAGRRTGRLVCGWGAGSTMPLPVSGGEIEFTGCRYSVEPGQRFGVWIRVVRESDGLGSVEIFLDVIRPEMEQTITNYELPITSCGVAERQMDREQRINREVAKLQRGEEQTVAYGDAMGILTTDLTLRREGAEGSRSYILDG